MAKKLYLASPFGFSEAGKYFMYDKLVPAIESQGFQVLDPWKLTDEKYIQKVLSMPEGRKKIQALEEMNFKIGQNNEKAILESSGIVAVLDGSDLDSGVAGEIGFGAAKGRKTLGYRNDFRLTGENLGSKVNLQIAYFIESRGGVIVANLEQVREKLVPMFGNPR